MKILIVDDDFISRKLLAKALEKKGTCDFACSGKEAMEAFTLAHTEETPYKLMLLDIMMPEMDGNEVLRKVREFEFVHHIHGSDRIRIVMATCLSDKEHVIGSFRDECDGYILKPYSPSSVLNDLERDGVL